MLRGHVDLGKRDRDDGGRRRPRAVGAEISGTAGFEGASRTMPLLVSRALRAQQADFLATAGRGSFQSCATAGRKQDALEIKKR